MASTPSPTTRAAKLAAREKFARDYSDATDVSGRGTPSPPPQLDEAESPYSPRTSLLDRETLPDHRSPSPRTPPPPPPPPLESAPQEPAEERSYIFETRVEKARELWHQGKAEFEAGEVDAAKKLFERGLHHVDFDELSFQFELQDEHRAQVLEVKIPLLLNLALIALKRNDGAAALEWCTQATTLDPKHAKALYRRGLSHAMMGNDDKAKPDFEHALRLAPKSAEVRRALAECQQRLKASERDFAKDLRAIKGLFASEPVVSASEPASWLGRLLALFWSLWALVTRPFATALRR